MKAQDKKSTRNFSIIFNKIEEFNRNNPDFILNFVPEEELLQGESIRVFSDICKEINSNENSPAFMTFS